jgi:hypothetical protein
MKSCPYCAQTETRKDKYGYCKKHSCFYVSGTKDKLDDLKKQLSDTIFLPTYKRNMFDNQPYNPRQEKKSFIYKKIQELLGFIPLEILS